MCEHLHVRAKITTYMKRVDTFDDAFGDNRISVSSNDVYRLITTLGVTRYREGKGTWELHESHRDRYELTTTFVYHESHGACETGAEQN